MKRRPPASDEEAKEPPASPASAAPPTWPATSQPEKVEVALFIIPGPVKPWSSVIDVRSASRLQIAGFESPSLDEFPAEALAEPLANAVVESGGAEAPANELALNTEPLRTSPGGAVPDLELFAEDGGDGVADRPLEAFPSGSLEALDVFPSEVVAPVAAEVPAPVAARQMAQRGLTSGAAVLAAALVTAARLWSRAAARMTSLGSAAWACTTRNLTAVRSRFGAVNSSAAWKSAVAAATRLKVTTSGMSSKTKTGVAAASSRGVAEWSRVAAAYSTVVAPAMRKEAARSWSGTKRLSAAMLSALVAWLRATPGPAAWKSRAGKLQSSAVSQLGRWQTSLATLPAIRRRQLGLGTAAAMSILLAMGIARLAQQTIANPDRVSQVSEVVPLAVQPLSMIANLAPGIGARTTGLAAPVELDRRGDTTARASAVPTATPVADSAPRMPASAPRMPALTPRVPVTASSADTSVAASVPPSVISEAMPNDAVAAAAIARADDAARPDSPAMPPEPEAPVRASLPAPAVEASRPAERAAAPAADASANDGIAEALRSLQLAYERRDATLAKAVWPTVDERALARAFDGLRSQSVTFDRCQLNVSGPAGEVECRGVTRYVPRVGGQYQRVESRQWKFRMQKGAQNWVITSAAAR